MDNTGYRSLLSYIKQEIRIDGSLYKERPFKRRIKLRMRYTETESYSEYLYYLRKNHEEMKLLKDALTINVTRFYRNRSTFEHLDKLIKEKFVSKQKFVSILSVGCSSGEEAYTMGLIMNNLKSMYNVDYSILGIDVDDIIIAKAKLAQYNDFSMKEIRKSEVKKYFNTSENIYSLKEQFKKNVKFMIMDIKSFSEMKRLGRYDIILCRNVLIYFSKEFQEMIMKVFHEMLSTDGILILGKIEIIMGSFRNYYDIISKQERIYKKIGH